MGARKPVLLWEDASEDDWRARAGCRDAHPETFFPTGSNPAEALSWCRACPVREACLDFALAVEAVTRSRHGIYGGMTEMQRHNHVRKLARRARAAS